MLPQNFALTVFHAVFEMDREDKRMFEEGWWNESLSVLLKLGGVLEKDEAFIHR